MRKRIIKAGVLAAVFIAALLVSSLLINRGTDDKIVDMGAPALPRVSFFVGGTEVNPLFGYTQDMDITAMRDTIVPLGTDGSLKMRIQAEEGQVDAARYEVYSLNGEDMYTKGEVRIPEGEAETRLDIGNILSESNREAVLKVILTLGDDRSAIIPGSPCRTTSRQPSVLPSRRNSMKTPWRGRIQKRWKVI